MGMKAAADSNELVFTLRVAPHTRNKADLDAFAQDVIKTQKKIHDGASSIRGTKSSLAGFGIPDERELAKASAAQLRHQQRMADAQRKALDKEQERVRKAADDAVKEAAKAAAAKAKIDKKAADDAIREAKRAAAEIEREEDRLHQRHRERQLNRARRNRTAREEAAENVVAGLERTERTERREERDRDLRSRRLREAGRGFSDLLHGGGDLVRGVAYSGLVGEKDSQKILDTLLRMEGTLGLIYGALSIGKGLAALGPLGGAGAAAAAGVAFAGATAYSFYSDPTFTGKSKNFGKDTQRPSWWNPANLYGRGKKGTMWEGGAADADWRGVHEGIARADSQEKYLAEQAKMRESDAAEFSRSMSTLSENSEFRRRGHRGDKAERADLQADLEDAKKLQEVLSQAAIKSEQDAEQRKAIAKQIYDITRQIADVDIRGQREVNSLMLSRRERTLGLVGQRQGEQLGLAKEATGRLRSDQARFGEMDPLEQMRVKSAAEAFRSGRSTREQRQLLSGFNEFQDEIDAHNARLGGAAGGGLFRKGTEQADAAIAEDKKIAAELAEASKAVVDMQHKIVVELRTNGDEAAADAANQALEFLKEEFARRDREAVRKRDEIQRERNAQERNREVIARR